ncbi:nociceptin receptor isoform X1 [Arapaima gigas]
MKSETQPRYVETKRVRIERREEDKEKEKKKGKRNAGQVERDPPRVQAGVMLSRRGEKRKPAVTRVPAEPDGRNEKKSRQAAKGSARARAPADAFWGRGRALVDWRSDLCSDPLSRGQCSSHNGEDLLSLMELSKEPAAFRDAKHNRWNESLYQGNFSVYNDTDVFLPTGVRVTIVVVYMIVCMVGLVGNCLVMYVIIRYTKMKTATNIYIFNLALADSLVLATLPFQGTDVFLGFWPFGNILCKIVISIDYYNMFTSTFTLTMMSVDRYIAVCHPVKALDMRTPHKAKVINICIWILASAIGVPAMVVGDVEVEASGIECIVVLPDPRSYWDLVFGTCVFLYSFLIPVIIISICYSLMVKRLRSVRILSGSKEKDRNLRRITRMVLVVVVVFVVCWTPIQIMALAQSLGVNLGSMFTVVLMHLCIALGYVNSSLNPVLYAFLDENFKRCFREFCYPSTFRLDAQQSGRMRSIAREVAYNCKVADGNSNPT